MVYTLFPKHLMDIIEDNIDLDDNEKSECSSEKFITADKMLIYMHREEFDKAINILVQSLL